LFNFQEKAPAPSLFPQVKASRGAKYKKQHIKAPI
jgi:hypothetical protein